MTLSEHLKENLNFDKRLFFILLCLLTFLLLIVKKNFIESEIAAFEILAEQGQGGMFYIINSIQYISIPLIYFLKFTIIAFVIWVGCFTFGYKVTYSVCWKITMVAEAIFLVPEILKILYFLFIQRDPTFTEVSSFYPFSLMNLVNYQELSKSYWYPLKAINIFEVIYWLLLALGIQWSSKLTYRQSLLIVLSSYTVLFLVWLGFYITVYK